MRSIELTATLTAAALTLAAALMPAAPARAAGAPRGADVTGQLIVKWRAGVAPDERRGALRARNVALVRALPGGATVVGRVPSGAPVTQAVRALERDPRVAWAEPNAVRRGGALPNDPAFGEEWGLQNTGQTVDGVAGAAGADIGAPAAWDRTTGSPDVKVAVVDSGIALDHPDLAPNLWRNPGESGAGRETNGVDDDGNGFVDDWRGWDFVQGDNDPSDAYGHGTHVAGTIAARGDNGIGVAGVAWRASIIPVRVLDNLNAGSCADTAAGMAYAVRAGARIVNLSLGASVPCQAELDVIDGAPNTLFVVAAMNDGIDVDADPIYPCAYTSPNIVCVAATDSSDRLADFSNRGARSVDLAAPGVNILSSFLRWGPTESLLTDGFETPLTGRWVTGGSPDSWVRTPFVAAHDGGWSLSNSLLGSSSGPADTWARLTAGLDLRGHSDCAARFWLRSGLGPFDPGQPVDAQSRLIAETSSDGTTWDRRPDLIVGSSSGFERRLVDLSQLEGRATGGLRFRLVVPAGAPSAGVTIDDLEVLCVPALSGAAGGPDDFAFDFGTSMAAPHVSGAAVLLLALQPSLTATDVRQRLLRSVDPLPGLQGLTVSGGRLDVARAVGPAPAPAPAPAGPQAAGPRGPSPSWALGVDLRALALSIRRTGPRGVLRAGAVKAARLHALGPGRFTLEVRGPGGRLVARGSRSVRRPAVCTLTAPLRPGGRALLRGAGRTRLSLRLVFAPASGARLVRQVAVTVGRRPAQRGRRTVA